MAEELLLMNTPLPDEYKIVKILGIVTGLTARTRGIGGKFIAGLEGMVGGEVSAFTSEMEKARFEAIERLKQKATQLGANAVVGIDIETSEVYIGTVLVSATGTALIISPKK
ncbi:MAG: YbjQ family protein [Candidatus Diapherotrites archaeon]|nr:YbjQ family protein [Candidatus Diapherotrites archaeon]